MNDGRDSMNARIDAYLDGGLSAAERAEIDARADSALAAELDLQHKIDGRLRVIMAAPAAPGADAVVLDPQPAVAGRVGRRWMLAAAALLLCAFGVWAGIAQPWHSWFGPARATLSANAAYQRLVDGGLHPDWVCDSEEVFKKYATINLGQEFTIAPVKGQEIVGWTYVPGLMAGASQVLLARVDNQPVVLVLGKKADDRVMHVDAGSPLKLHRKELWGLVMYEISPRDQAAVLPNIVGPGCGH